MSIPPINRRIPEIRPCVFRSRTSARISPRRNAPVFRWQSSGYDSDHLFEDPDANTVRARTYDLILVRRSAPGGDTLDFRAARRGSRGSQPRRITCRAYTGVYSTISTPRCYSAYLDPVALHTREIFLDPCSFIMATGKAVIDGYLIDQTDAAPVLTTGAEPDRQAS